jgi:hypothetical protein
LRWRLRCGSAGQSGPAGFARLPVLHFADCCSDPVKGEVE